MEKTLVLYMLLLLFSSFPSISVGAHSTVLDVEGQELSTGTSYYILPATHGNGGGLALSSRIRMCPKYVMQETEELSNGLPLRFLPLDRKEKAIRLSSDVNIEFYAATTCVQSTGWKVGEVDELSGKRYVTSGGLIGRPGNATVTNWFKIEEQGEGYKIVYCPSVCDFCKVACGSVGVFNEGGKKWLALTDDEPFLFMFKKV